MVSPGPRRKGFYPRQPSDLREGVTNAYIVLREVGIDVKSLWQIFIFIYYSLSVSDSLLLIKLTRNKISLCAFM